MRAASSAALGAAGRASCGAAAAAAAAVRVLVAAGHVESEGRFLHVDRPARLAQPVDRHGSFPSLPMRPYARSPDMANAAGEALRVGRTTERPPLRVGPNATRLRWCWACWSFRRGVEPPVSRRKLPRSSQQLGSSSISSRRLAQRGYQAVERHNEHVALHSLDASCARQADHRTHPAGIAPSPAR
jgi:hypothetical protein